MNKQFSQKLTPKDYKLLKTILPTMSRNAVVGCDARVCRVDRNRIKVIFSIFDLPRTATSVFYVKLNQLSAAALSKITALDMEFEHFAIDAVDVLPTLEQQRALASYLIGLERTHQRRRRHVG